MRTIWNRVTIIFIIIFLGISIIFYDLSKIYSFNKAMVYLFNVDNNELIVKVKKPLLKEKVKIKLYIEDEESTIYGDGERKERIDNEYGIYEFTVIYDNRYYVKFKHLRDNWHNQYRYSFAFKKRGKEIVLKMKVEFDGIENLKSTQVMGKIKDVK